MKLLLDLDGVLVDFVGGACRELGFEYPYDDPRNHLKYDIISVFNERKEDGTLRYKPGETEGITAKDFWAPMGEDFWANLQPYRHMGEVVSFLEGIFGQENICLLTSPCETPGCTKGKMRWINDHLPAYSRRFLIGPAKEFTARGNLLIDDYEGNAQKFRGAGGFAWVFPQMWNSRWKEKDAAVDLLKEQVLGFLENFRGLG